LEGHGHDTMDGVFQSRIDGSPNATTATGEVRA
jgi:hypothetical protein